MDRVWVKVRDTVRIRVRVGLRVRARLRVRDRGIRVRTRAHAVPLGHVGGPQLERLHARHADHGDAAAA